MYITLCIKIVWLIKDNEGYGFGTDKVLYNIKRNKPLKKVYNNGCLGYYINSKFISLKKLKQLLYKPEKVNLPF